MKIKKNNLGLFVIALSVVLLCSDQSGIQAQGAQHAEPKVITRFRIQPKSGGPLFVTIGGTEKRIASEALHAWIIEGGRKIAYTTSEAPGEMGAGGTLMVYDAQTNQHKKLATSEDDLVGLKEVHSSGGQTALILETSGAENCAPEVMLIDPTRGKVFSDSPAQVLSIKGDVMLLGYFKEAEWEKNCESKKMNSYKSKSFSLSALLKRPVITR